MCAPRSPYSPMLYAPPVHSAMLPALPRTAPYAGTSVTLEDCEGKRARLTLFNYVMRDEDPQAGPM